MCVGPCSIPMETTHNYPSDSSKKLMGKKPSASKYRALLAQIRGLYVCTFVRYYLMAHNSEYFMQNRGKSRTQTCLNFFKKKTFIAPY